MLGDSTRAPWSVVPCSQSMANDPRPLWRVDWGGLGGLDGLDVVPMAPDAAGLATAVTVSVALKVRDKEASLWIGRGVVMVAVGIAKRLR